MSAAPLVTQSGPPTEVTLLRLFEHLDQHGIDGAISTVDMVLNNGQQMAVMAGGPGVHCAPDFPPFHAYEVIFNQDPPKYWNRYTDEVALLYAYVPRLLIAHHITRAGGVREASRTVRRAKVSSPDRMLLVNVAGSALSHTERLLRQIEGVEIVSVSEPH